MLIEPCGIRNCYLCRLPPVRVKPFPCSSLLSKPWVRDWGRRFFILLPKPSPGRRPSRPSKSWWKRDCFRSVTLTPRKKSVLDTPVCDLKIALMPVVITIGSTLRHGHSSPGWSFDPGACTEICKNASGVSFCTRWILLCGQIIICDYNHAFDPRAYLQRFFDTEAMCSWLMKPTIWRTGPGICTLPYNKNSRLYIQGLVEAVCTWVCEGLLLSTGGLLRPAKPESKYDTRVVDFPADLVSCVREFTRSWKSF